MVPGHSVALITDEFVIVCGGHPYLTPLRPLCLLSTSFSILTLHCLLCLVYTSLFLSGPSARSLVCAGPALFGKLFA